MKPSLIKKFWSTL